MLCQQEDHLPLTVLTLVAETVEKQNRAKGGPTVLLTHLPLLGICIIPSGSLSSQNIPVLLLPRHKVGLCFLNKSKVGVAR